MSHPGGKLAARARSIKLLILDVDGVLTDGRIVMDDRGREIKSFNVRDGHGLKMLMRAGIEVIFLTGRRSRVVEHRASDLGVGEVYQGALNKLEIYENLLEKRKYDASQVAYIGDDIVDLPLLNRAGLAVTVSDAVDEAKAVAHYVTKNRGGHGAVREVCEILLKAQGRWDDLVSRYEIRKGGSR